MRIRLADDDAADATGCRPITVKGLRKLSGDRVRTQAVSQLPEADRTHQIVAAAIAQVLEELRAANRRTRKARPAHPVSGRWATTGADSSTAPTGCRLRSGA